MNINYEFACQDDCLDKMLPSDLRKLICDRDQAYLNVNIVKAERDALAAQVEALKEALKPAVRLMRTTGQYSGWHEKADEAESLVNRELTTQQHLAEVRAQAVIDAINVGFTPEQFHALKKSRDGIDLQADAAIKGWWACWEWVDSDDRDKLTLIPAANQYADSIRKGEVK